MIREPVAGWCRQVVDQLSVIMADPGTTASLRGDRLGEHVQLHLVRDRYVTVDLREEVSGVRHRVQLDLWQLHDGMLPNDADVIAQIVVSAATNHQSLERHPSEDGVQVWGDPGA